MKANIIKTENQYVNLRTGGILTTRREAVKGLGAILATGCAPWVARGGLLGARGAVFGGAKKYTARDYVQDGLIAMWDGIENAGWGVHESNPSVWKDLIGTRDLSKIGSVAFNEDNVQSTDFGQKLSTEHIDNIFCIELVAEVFDFAYSVPVGFLINNADTYQSSGLSRFNFVIAENRGTSVRPRGYQLSRYKTAASNDVLSKSSVSINVGLSYRQNNNEMTLVDLDNNWNSDNKFCVFGRRDNGHYDIKAKVYTIRCYSRNIGVDEVAANYAVDKARFNLP